MNVYFRQGSPNLVPKAKCFYPDQKVLMQLEILQREERFITILQTI